ncbi:HicB family protein [Parvimonas micra]|jgi:hypothetical protein
MFVVYPFVFKKESPKGYFIESVDIKEAYTGINTDDISFGISMAEEVLGLVLSEYVERGIELPKATPIKNVKIKNDEFVTLIRIDLEKFLKDTSLVKKTLSIPKWANDKGTRLGINFSKVLTESILKM